MHAWRLQYFIAESIQLCFVNRVMVHVLCLFFSSVCWYNAFCGAILHVWIQQLIWNDCWRSLRKVISAIFSGYIKLFQLKILIWPWQLWSNIWWNVLDCPVLVLRGSDVLDNPGRFSLLLRKYVLFGVFNRLKYNWSLRNF